MKKALTLISAVLIITAVFARSPTSNMNGLLSIGIGTVHSDTGYTISDTSQLNSLPFALSATDTLTFQHTQSLNTIQIKTGDLIKVKNYSGKVKGKIISISDNYISIKPKSKKDAIVDSIDASQLIWLRKYKKSRALYATGVGVKIIGFTGLPVSVLIFLYGRLGAELYWWGAGGFLTCLAIIRVGTKIKYESNLKGSKRHIDSNRWTLVQ